MNNDGHTAITSAIFDNKIAIVEMLLAAGA